MIPSWLKVMLLLGFLVMSVIAFWYGLILIAGGKATLVTLAILGGISVIKTIVAVGRDIVKSV